MRHRPSWSAQAGGGYSPPVRTLSHGRVDVLVEHPVDGVVQERGVHRRALDLAARRAVHAAVRSTSTTLGAATSKVLATAPLIWCGQLGGRRRRRALLCPHALDDDDVLPARVHRRARRRATSVRAGCDSRTTLLDVLRVDVATVDDQQVLEPAGDEEVAVASRNRGRRCAGTGRRPRRCARRTTSLGLCFQTPVARASRCRPATRSRPRSLSGSDATGLRVDDPDVQIGRRAAGDEPSRHRPRAAGTAVAALQSRRVDVEVTRGLRAALAVASRVTSAMP